MGTPVKFGSELFVSSAAKAGEFDPAITALTNGRFVVTWGDSGSSFDMRARLVDADGDPLGSDFLIPADTASNQFNPIAAGLTGGGFVVTWKDIAGPTQQVRGRLFAADGSAGNEFVVSGQSGQAQQPAVTALADGRFVVSWFDETLDNGFGDVLARIYNSDGSPATAAFTVPLAAGAVEDRPRIAALAGGGFVVAFESDDEIAARIFDANGTPVGGEFQVNDATTTTLSSPVIGALADGRFVVAWTDPVLGDVRARIFDPNGGASGAEFIVNTNTTGSQNAQAATGLPDGRFVILFGSPDGAGSGVFGQLYDASGAPSGEVFRVNTTIAGAQFSVSGYTVAPLADGRFAATWVSSFNAVDDIVTQIFDARDAGVTVAGSPGNDAYIGTTFDDSLSGGGGSDALLAADDNDILNGGSGADELDGGAGIDTAVYSGTRAQYQVTQFANGSVHVSDLRAGAPDGADILLDVEQLAFLDGLFAVDGTPLPSDIAGTADNDTLVSTAGDNGIDGRSGDDTAVFSQSLDKYTVTDFGTKIVVSGPDGLDTLVAVEHLRFADGTITPQDGNPLFDTAFYLSHNPDVYRAGVDALAHFNAFGRHEGRDPNAFFDTTGYSAANGLAARLDPLDHYHQIGFREGADPGPDFDTTLYLIHNPDVAAAGVDPLQHFLQFGRAEGRQPFAAIGLNIHNGFDAEFYLLHNPDVAAARVDPLWHFDTFGRHEGRNPNAWFDTAGYLAHYADVAAAGVNPLEHYEQFGWKEGRDPSAAFDTLGYLAANPDVAAAGVNPLDHFLTFGIYEGRQIVNDGLFR